MEHRILEAKTSVVTELGQFEALVSAWGSDREGDTISLVAFDKTIAAWRASGKRIPLLWEHESQVVGHIDPATMHPTSDGLVAEGQIDRETEKGEAAWKLIKSGASGFSIGFMAVESEPRPNGGRRLTEIDLLEISVTSKPMHASTMALSWKASSRPLAEQLVASFDVDSYREKEAEPATKSTGPIRVATFDC